VRQERKWADRALNNEKLARISAFRVNTFGPIKPYDASGKYLF
jgi:hypothetical protein